MYVLEGLCRKFTFQQLVTKTYFSSLSIGLSVSRLTNEEMKKGHISLMLSMSIRSTLLCALFSSGLISPVRPHSFNTSCSAAFFHWRLWPRHRLKLISNESRLRKCTLLCGPHLWKRKSVFVVGDSRLQTQVNLPSIQQGWKFHSSSCTVQDMLRKLLFFK